MDFINTIYNELVRPFIESIFPCMYTFNDPDPKSIPEKKLSIVNRLKKIDELTLCKNRIQVLLVEANTDFKETPKRRNWLTYLIKCLDDKIQQHINLL